MNSFLPTQAENCETFHLKVFGKPIPTTLLPPAHTKKPRKPKLTRARPSTETLHPDHLSRPDPRPVQRAPSETSQNSHTRQRESAPDVMDRHHSLNRSISRTSDQFRRSRSRSIDPSPMVGHKAESYPNAKGVLPMKKTLSRALSGKGQGQGLFKGREVGLMKRSISVAARKERQREKESQSQSFGREESQRFGLLGRKTSDGQKARRFSNDGMSVVWGFESALTYRFKRSTVILYSAPVGQHSHLRHAVKAPRKGRVSVWTENTTYSDSRRAFKLRKVSAKLYCRNANEPG